MALVGPHIETLEAYEPGKPIEELERELGITDSIKLASNENPLGTSPRAAEAIREAASRAHFYPDGGAFALKADLSGFLGVDASELMTGNGSNELLTLVVRTFCQPGDTAVVSDHAFVAYSLILAAANVPTTSVPMADGYVHDLDAMAAACDDTTKLVFVANPNNPTGTYVGAAKLKRFLRRVPEHVVVVVDEAYVEYALAEDYVSALELRDVRENLIVCRTFSKCYGLAGCRCGFAVAPSKLVDYVNRVREPFNTNLVAQAAARAALDDREFVRRSVRANEEGRALLEEGLSELRDVTWTPSQTNFLLVATPYEGRRLYELMLREGVIVRPVGGYGLPHHLRITIGTPVQVERCLDALGTALDQLESS